MVGFDIGGTKCAVCVGEASAGGLRVADRREFPTDLSLSPEETVGRLCRLAESMTGDLSSIGISCGGPLDPEKGVILSPPNLPGWDDFHICDMLRERYGGRVSLRNDADGCALAEWKFGAGRGVGSMIFLTFGTGMGAGLILGGRLYTGASGMAGEVGHIRLAPRGPEGHRKAGSFEGFCSGGGIAAMGRAAAGLAQARGGSVSFLPRPGGVIDAKTVADAADAGFADAAEIYRRSGEMLGKGLAILIDILNPELIVIGSIFRRSEALLREAMEKSLREECLPGSLAVCRIVASELGDRIGDYAALCAAAENEVLS